MGYYRAEMEIAQSALITRLKTRCKRTFIGRYVLIKPHRTLCIQGIERLTALVSSNIACVYNDIDSLVVTDGRSTLRTLKTTTTRVPS